MSNQIKPTDLDPKNTASTETDNRESKERIREATKRLMAAHAETLRKLAR